jgi:hypothetical protein
VTWVELTFVAVGGIAVAAIMCWASVAIALRIERRRRATTTR